MQRTSLVAIVLILTASASSYACSCVTEWPGSFFDPAPEELPANGSGVIWQGVIEDPQGDGEGPFEFFAVQELNPDGSVVDLEADVKLLLGPPQRGTEEAQTEWVDAEPRLVSPRREGAWVEIGEERSRIRYRSDGQVVMFGTWVIAPAEGLRPGATYRFSYGQNDPKLRSERVDDRSLVVTVSEDAVEPAGELDLRQGEANRLEVTISADASCSTVVDAQRVALAMDVPPESYPFTRSIFYTTLVNGEVWKPTYSLCDSPDPGASWRGRGRDELYLSCGQIERGLAESRYHRSEGRYEVEMIAWLPGRFEVGRGRTSVELTCDDE